MNSCFDIDPVRSLIAMQIVSWHQDADTLDLVHIKLNECGFKLDKNLEIDLENFVKMKQKFERNKDLHKSEVALNHGGRSPSE